MKREEIKAIFADATDEQLNSVMNLNGADIENFRRRVSALEADLKTKSDDFARVTNELNTLKENNATAEDFKHKFEDLQNEIAEKEAQAKAEREAKEKADNIANRFNTVVGERQ